MKNRATTRAPTILPCGTQPGWRRSGKRDGGSVEENQKRGAILVVDEIQKVSGWAETVKRLWDEDRRRGLDLKVVLLGSAALLVQRGLGESLAGRFELIRAPHWSFAEMRDAFGVSLDEFIHFGGYPGAADLIGDEPRWVSYVLDSIVETTISRDLLLLTRVDKPALLRSLFRLVCDYSAQIVSYQKLTGQLQDAGNTTTLAHYLDLLAAAGLAVGLEKFAPGKVRQRRSTPKLMALDTALVSASSGRSFAEARADREHWGRLVETAVGAHLYAGLDPGAELLYWRDRSREVDFVLERGGRRTAIEVKSGRRRDGLPGMEAFEKAHGPARKLLVGGTDPARSRARRRCINPLARADPQGRRVGDRRGYMRGARGAERRRREIAPRALRGACAGRGSPSRTDVLRL